MTSTRTSKQTKVRLEIPKLTVAELVHLAKSILDSGVNITLDSGAETAVVLGAGELTSGTIAAEMLKYSIVEFTKNTDGERIIESVKFFK